MQPLLYHEMERDIYSIALTIFFSFQKNLTMKVPAHSKMKIVCPNPASVLQETESSIPLEQMYSNLWIVTKQEFDICKINASDQRFSNEKRLLMSCNNPLQLKYYEMVFRAYTVPGSIAYEPGNSYYFIGKTVDHLPSLKELDNEIFKKCEGTVHFPFVRPFCERSDQTAETVRKLDTGWKDVRCSSVRINVFHVCAGKLTLTVSSFTISQI